MTEPIKDCLAGQRRPLRRAWIVLAAVLTLLAAQVFLPYRLHFDSVRLAAVVNVVIAGALLGSAWSLAVSAVHPIWRRLAVWGAAVLMIPCVVVIGINLMDFWTADSSGHEPIDTVELGQGWRLRLYRSDCGATCADGLVLRKELDTGLGIAFVRSLWSRNRAYEGRLQMQHDGRSVLVWPDRGDAAMVALD